ncbi:redoxin domain-containing protein [Botrimarina mediterranea]|uniref:Thiol-disulfide oxidoreductase YkuV n=1 Tax=Botrimarina mediterranea TaxID=2528022 RepID=A0A518K4K3_9BACT|nr:redoxin domain-containing protein [Botrimarina mediterranea]QDV72726.1 Thiol-disulfide oxidoreductase YkuV [Botrimarina mediterranea]
MRAQLCALLFSALAPAFAFAQVADTEKLLPQRLLQLVHTPEVQAELKLTPGKQAALEKLLTKLDAVWLPSRNLSPDEMRTTVAGLEEQVRQWVVANLSKQQARRLHQLECQAQGVRAMLREAMGKRLELSPEQINGFLTRAQATEAVQEELRQAQQSGSPTEEIQTRLKETVAAEQAALAEALTPQQHEAMWKLLGEPFDTSKLTRIYPLAPEFVRVDDWINSKPLTLKSFRGKVVLVHFYAFQCHNCHANFDIYKRWHDELAEKGVVLIGIQTPETSSERDPKLVKAAAAERGLEFPILVDLESKNWAAWGNTMWPTVYVVDKNGYIRSWWMGELNWQGATGDKSIEEMVEVALAEAGPEEKS